ncbi:MAG TPA: c-type cytochrome [Burkholderiales bacterium]|jgi:mono/diheme cytochrome c family protein|nr:c-type cytochrome [Burkholderiales bacterium]
MSVRPAKPAVAAALLSVALGAPCAAPTALKNPFEGDEQRVEEGRSLFNQYCSHCHAPNAQTGERVRDVRRMKIRYGERMTEVFWKTVQEGRVDRGMPAWQGALPEETLWSIYTFIQSVQKER